MVIITEKTLKKLVKEFLITIGYLSIATLIGMLLIYIGFTESNVTMVYLLCVLLLSIFTNGYIWSVAGIGKMQSLFRSDISGVWRVRL